MNVLSTEEFDQLFTELQETYPDVVDWTNRIYTTKEKWAQCWIAEHACLGAHTTGRGEAMNKIIKRLVTRSTPLVTLFSDIQRSTVETQLRRHALIRHRIVGVTDRFQTGTPEAQLQRILSTWGVARCVTQLSLSLNYVVVECADDQSSIDTHTRVYTVTHKTSNGVHSVTMQIGPEEAPKDCDISHIYCDCQTTPQEWLLPCLRREPPAGLGRDPTATIRAPVANGPAEVIAADEPCPGKASRC
jgi:hypothetical protein